MKRVKFAIVGHPNKGKSSIVATLAQNDNIEISSRSGTTEKANVYRVETRHSGYELIDTPGFQRPTKVLAWLKQKATNAYERSQAIQDFINDSECQQKFPDEVELLKPIIKGAAVLYVVDGSRPYGVEYDAEMEILGWTGQPSMALINPIGKETDASTGYIDLWKDILNQYFKTVRVFNPMTAEFDKQLELLKTFSHLHPDWADTLELTIIDLQDQRSQQKETSALILARLLDDLCFYRHSQKMLNKKQGEAIQSLLKKQYKSWMIKREQQAIQELFANYAHYQTDYSINELELPPELFDFEQWYAWGLNKKQLTTVATMSGAATGAVLDFSVGGHSFMLGALTGGLTGFLGSHFGSGKLVSTKFKGLPLGGYEIICGPIKHKNFPYVVIGRFVFLYQQISQRNHAVRDDLIIQDPIVQDRELYQIIEKLEKKPQQSLHKACDQLIKQKKINNLRDIVLPLF